MGKHRAAKAPPAVPLLDHILALLEAADQRYRQWFTEKDLRDQQRFEAQERGLAAALSAADRATAKAEVAAEKRFEAVNEFRGQLADQAATLMPRTEAEQRFSALTEKIDEQRKTIDALREMAVAVGGRSAGMSAGYGYLIAAVGAISAVVAIIYAFTK